MMYDQQDINEDDTSASLESSANEFLDIVDSPRVRYFEFVPSTITSNDNRCLWPKAKVKQLSTQKIT